jgi:ATP-binding protein involved in chromosome partitioning
MPNQEGPRGPVPPGPGGGGLLPEVRNIIAVSSGKGGVGKSTVAVNVAVALARTGARVGLLDADVYGPNIPMMFGIDAQPAIVDGRIEPHERHGVRLMSLGFLVPPEEALIWRGPMVMQALEQLLRDVNWGALDYLLVDMPPGTGDAQLTLVQKVPLAGAVLVTTPQAVALGDTIKGLMMFRKTETPVLGMVENMSLFHCPHCGQPTELFRRGTVESACRRHGVPYLGEIPFDVECREGGDLGTPITAARPDSPVARAFTDVAGKILAGLEAGGPSGGGRRVVPITRR